jgi:sn-glycerol 3-phosphate transport system substrate-binding protein
VRGHDYAEVPAEVSRLAAEGRPPTLVTYDTDAICEARDAVAPGGAPLFTSVEQAVGGRREILGEPVVLDDFLPAARGFLTHDGDFTSLPLTASTMVLYVNTTLLAAAGIDGVPHTWDEVEAACARLPGPGITWPNDGRLFQQWVSQQRGLLVDRDNGRAGPATSTRFTSSEMLALVAWWRRLYADGNMLYTGVKKDVAGSTEGVWAGAITAFAEQRVAMRVGSSFEAGYVRRAGEQGGFEVAVCRLPHRDAVPPAGNWIGGDSFWLTGGLDPETTDGALAFLQYLNAPDNAAAWHRASGSIPMTRGAVGVLDDEGWFTVHPERRAAIEQIGLTDGSPGSYSPIVPGSHGFHQALTRAMDDVLVRGADPAQRFAAAATEADRVLAGYNDRKIRTYGDAPAGPGSPR